MKGIIIPTLPRNTIPEGFNWLTVLKDLADGAPIDQQSYTNLCTMSGNWPTCACGQACSALLKPDGDHEPRDGELSTLGLEFNGNIQCRDWTRALKTFHHIEERSFMLLKDMGAIDIEE